MPLDSLITVELHPHRHTWAYVEAGDMIVYDDDGASYYVEAIVVDEKHQTTFALRSVVSPTRYLELDFWELCHYSVGKNDFIFDGITVTKG